MYPTHYCLNGSLRGENFSNLFVLDLYILSAYDFKEMDLFYNQRNNPGNTQESRAISQ